MSTEYILSTEFLVQYGVHLQSRTLVLGNSRIAERKSSETSSCISTRALWLPESFCKSEDRFIIHETEQERQ